MKHLKTHTLIALVYSLLFCNSLSAQLNVTFSFDNVDPMVIVGTDTFYHADIMISCDAPQDAFTMGSGQIYLNYNESFGSNVTDSENLEIFYGTSDYLLSLEHPVFAGANVYEAPRLTDNTPSRVSIFWQQLFGGSCISDMVTDVPRPLFRVQFKYDKTWVTPNMCFETGSTFEDQTYTACGPFTPCTGFLASDCPGEPGMLVADDGFTNGPGCLFPLCVVSGIPAASDINEGICESILPGWQHLTNTNGEVLLSVHPLGNNLGAISANLYIDNQPIDYFFDGMNTAYMQRHYKVSTENIPDSEVLLRFYFTDDELSALDIAAAMNNNDTDDVESLESISVTKYSGPSEDDILDLSDATDNIILTGEQYGQDFNANFIEIKVNDFSEFWLRGTPNLPIELIEFEAINYPEEVELLWQTASELNNDYFDIQRSSNGISFESLGRVQAVGNAQVLSNYNFIDETPLNGISYYRLRQVDLNGSYAYSQVVSVERKRLTDISIYPNPTKSELSIACSGFSEGELNCQLYNVNGQEVLSKSWYLQADDTVELSVSALPPGIYYIKILLGDNYFTQSFVKD